MEDIVQIIVFGLLSGFLATAAMTLSQIVEIAITKRASSLTPAIAISNFFRFDLEKFSDKNKWRLNNLVHWSYGLLWGVILAAVYTVFELHLLQALAVYFFVFWIQALIVLPALHAVPPPWTWDAKWIAIDAWHHLVYALVAATVYYILV
jgi:uncharacterized membrane protein YagU involved in acid resistance